MRRGEKSKKKNLPWHSDTTVWSGAYCPEVQTYAIRTDIREFIQRSQKLVTQSKRSRMTGSLRLNVHALWCSEERISLEVEDPSCIISFLGLGQETRNSPEGTLIRSRKQHEEHSFSPTGKSTQTSKISNFI